MVQVHDFHGGRVGRVGGEARGVGEGVGGDLEDEDGEGVEGFCGWGEEGGGE